MICKIFFSAVGGWSFLSFFRKLRKKIHVNPVNPACPVKYIEDMERSEFNRGLKCLFKIESIHIVTHNPKQKYFVIYK
jgi:hypothetical protein